MKQFALIVAGGNGSRMKSDVPKQFLLLDKLPVLMHSINRFYHFNPKIEILLVLPEVQVDTWKSLCKNYEFDVKHQIVHGGENRFQSVKSGLKAINGKGIVFIHDGVRPLVSFETISRCLETTLEKGNAVPILPVVESLRMVDNGTNRIEDREKYVSIQTPQTFYVEEIKAAYARGYDPLFTDDTSVLERTGKTINLVEGNRENIKITHPTDLIVAKALFRGQSINKA
ncbi:MAG: 2-C-methyl-D-erythritol 4-phosphate cytidylyltransferase [Prolixibacteraceae bacterium]|jgi:2-C-methyl-D-erythritol 4-phosphate cytidylyltransferase|nr:2-C-methyl-D-erythritol 4-phosphate cytidylyltransferase [Prolixibacteraceae bacterium]